MLPQPVPPRVTPRRPVTSLARSTSVAVTEPATAFKMPPGWAKVKRLEMMRFEVEACDVTARLVVVAFVVVVFVKSAFTKCEVEEAKMPFWAQIGDEVAAVSVPKLSAKIKSLVSLPE